MRVAVVVATQPADLPKGGVEKATQMLCRWLLEAGHDVTLVARGRGDGIAWGGVPAVYVGAPEEHMLLGGARVWNKAVAKALSCLDPDIAQGEGLGYAGAAVAAWRGGPRVVVAHGNAVQDIRHTYSRAGWALRAPLVRKTARIAVRHADVVVNVTPNWRVNCPVAPARMVHIPNAIEEDFFVIEPSPEPGTVVFFGGDRPIKGADLLLSAWTHVVRRFPGARLDLYGIAKAQRPTLPPRSRVLPAVWSSIEIARAMACANVVVIPSRFEVSPLIAAEAMAVGVPLVATDVGGMRAMTEGVAVLCEPAVDDMAASIIDTLGDPEAALLRVQKGRVRSAAYRIESVGAAYLKLYAEWDGTA